MKHKNVRWESFEGRMGWIRNGYTIMVGKSEGKRQVGRPGCKRVDTTIMVFKYVYIRYESVDRIILALISTERGELVDLSATISFSRN